MTNSIKNIWTNHKQQHQKHIEHEENSAFNIVEKNGVIYLTAGSRAIKTIKPETTAGEIIDMINECRETQLNFIKKS
ncbi:MAG: hypothetical protein NC548_26085 [Lachnospiraceae bacterium]|nr:hypothetical protein [Lachnospiraceae bacterium]